jgi:GNAT superfamily N-acetyltransferase
MGEALPRHAIDLARRRGCGLAQLTTDRTRSDAHRFYERLGFVARPYRHEVGAVTAGCGTAA